VPWFYAVAERDHAVQNPTSAAKIRRLGELLRLGPDSRVLDIACGRGGPALVLAETFGCRIVGVERAHEFVEVARTRIAEAGLDDRIEIVQTDASELPLERRAFDAALCLGASFVWGGLEETLAALSPTVRPGGHIVVGEPYWRSWPLPDDVADDGFTTLLGTAARFQAAGLAVVGVIPASEDDWDAYESLHWRALEEWLAEHPDDPDAAEIRGRHEAARDRYLGMQRELLGWAIVAGWQRT
jgi:SAM-dependent methyltransferase